MFQASRLKQLSLSTQKMAWETEPFLPDLRPLSQHLTQLCLQQCGCVGCGLDKFIAILQPLTRLQVLTISQTCFLEGLPRLLRALPHLHTLQLPDATVYGQEQLDSLLAATQLSSIQLNSLMGLTSSRADVPCSWQRLELTGDIGCSSAAHLPLQSLTQPLVLGELRTDYDNCKQVAAAAHNLTSCSVSVRIKVLHLDVAGLQHVKLQQLEASLQALNNCSWETVSVTHMNVGAANVATLAPLCQGCTKLEFAYSSLTPSLEFWRQLMQHMPTVTHLTFSNSSPAQPSPAQPSPAQPSPAQPSPAQPSPAQPSPAQPSPAQPSPAQPSPAQPSPAQPSPAQPSPAQPSPAQPSPAQPSPAQPSPAQPSPAQPSPAQPSPAQPSPAQPSPAQPSPAQPSPAQPSPAQPSPAQPSPAQPSPAQPSPAQPSPAQPSPAQPSPAQPSPAQPSPAQPSPAQPSPAQLSPPQPQATTMTITTTSYDKPPL
ncbi:hypothetical protein QJQ45_010511 [Haematococcus lacustris]|nr:hypothetical protein QJQ45_010511 [Haematococcus lacustris]